MWTAIEGDHPGFVDHLLKKRDIAWRLDDLCAITVNNGQYRPCYSTGDAADVKAEVLPGGRLIRRIVVPPKAATAAARAPATWSCAARRSGRNRSRSQSIAATSALAAAAAGLSLRSQRRRSSVRRIDHE